MATTAKLRGIMKTSGQGFSKNKFSLLDESILGRFFVTGCFLSAVCFGCESKYYEASPPPTKVDGSGSGVLKARQEKKEMLSKTFQSISSSLKYADKIVNLAEKLEDRPKSSNLFSVRSFTEKIQVESLETSSPTVFFGSIPIALEHQRFFKNSCEQLEFKIDLPAEGSNSTVYLKGCGLPDFQEFLNIQNLEKGSIHFFTSQTTIKALLKDPIDNIKNSFCQVLSTPQNSTLECDNMLYILSDGTLAHVRHLKVDPARISNIDATIALRSEIGTILVSMVGDNDNSIIGKIEMEGEQKVEPGAEFKLHLKPSGSEELAELTELEPEITTYLNKLKSSLADKIKKRKVTPIKSL